MSYTSLAGNFTVVTSNGVRIRRLPHPQFPSRSLLFVLFVVFVFDFVSHVLPFSLLAFDSCLCVAPALSRKCARMPRPLGRGGMALRILL